MPERNARPADPRSDRDSDPHPPDWASIALPTAWPDALQPTRIADLPRLLAPLLGHREPVALPTSLYGRERIPRYLLQEFHGLPNGFYSHRITRGYARWFDTTLLGTLHQARHRIGAAFQGLTSALDLGCGDGKLGEALVDAGVRDVWGIDPSPYLLQLGAVAHPRVRFVHGVAEDLPFRDERFDAIGACFVFHELPPRYATTAIRECARVLKPGGLLRICEPSPEQLEARSAWPLLRRHGWRGLYFRILARTAFEPFIAQWHARNQAEWLSDYGLELVGDDTRFPLRFLSARKPSP